MTGVPTDMQLLSYGTKLIRPNKKLQDYNLQDNCCVHLSVKGVGGNGGSNTGILKLMINLTTCNRHHNIIYGIICSLTESSDELLDECISCGEHAIIYCSTCKSSRCVPCNEQWHKHPKRRDHETKVSIYYCDIVHNNYCYE